MGHAVIMLLQFYILIQGKTICIIIFNCDSILITKKPNTV